MDNKQPDIKAISNDFFMLKPLPHYTPGHGHSTVKTSNNEIPSFVGISGSFWGLESSEKQNKYNKIQNFI